MHPRLFTSAIFLDPGFMRTDTTIGEKGEPVGPVNFNTWRPDLWPNREEAGDFVKMVSPDWDPRTVDLMIKYGFRDLPTALYPELPPDSDPSNPPVTLATSKHYSTLMQLRPCFYNRDKNGMIYKNRELYPDMNADYVRRRFYRPEVGPTNERLVTLRPSALFVLGRKTKFYFDDLRVAARYTGTGIGGSGGQPEGQVKEVIIQDGGHMIPFTHVAEVGDSCASWVGSEIVKFIDKEARWEAARSNMTKEEHLKLPAEWFKMIRNPFEPVAKGKL